MSDLRAQATDPHQYDEMDWLAEGDGQAPSRIFIREYIDAILDQLQPRSVLDIGCGGAWLSEVAASMGATRYVGMDPCRNSIAFAQEHYPDAEVHCARFEDFRTTETFDLAVCILATEHLDDLGKAFHRCRTLLRKDGTLLIVTGDFEATLRPRFDYQLVIEREGADEAVAKIIRPSDPVSTTDIVRTTKRFKQVAADAGFVLQQEMPMPATASYIAVRPKYEFYRDKAVFQLLLFTAN
jgi:2-polyprenyl-3-methyl-5-hydroxy-6-metoxy-1,4-benzoquinol methylase